MTRLKNEAGKTYGRLTVLRYSRTDAHGGAVWLCRCTCGEEVEVSGNHLRRGAVRSCGCLNREATAARRRAAADPLKGTREATAFSNMHRRCGEPGHNRFHLYGGRGIRVCARWSGADGLRNFLADMGPCPEGMSLDRIDVNGDYGPGNCRWADARTQANNTRRNVRVELNGEVHTLAEWSRLLGLNYATVWRRFRKGRPVEEVLYRGSLVYRGRADEQRGR